MAYPYPRSFRDDDLHLAFRPSSNSFVNPSLPADFESVLEASLRQPNVSQYRHYFRPDTRAEAPSDMADQDYDLQGLSELELVECSPLQGNVSPRRVFEDIAFKKAQITPRIDLPRYSEQHELNPCYLQGYHSPVTSRHSSWSVQSGQREDSPLDTNMSSKSSCSHSHGLRLGMNDPMPFAGSSSHTLSLSGGANWSCNPHIGQVSHGNHEQQQQQQQQFNEPMFHDVQAGHNITLQELNISLSGNLDVEGDAFSSEGAQLSFQEGPAFVADSYNDAEQDTEQDAEGEIDDGYDETFAGPWNAVEEQESDSDYKPGSSSKAKVGRRNQLPRAAHQKQTALTLSKASGGVTKRNGRRRGDGRTKRPKSNAKGKSAEVINKAVTENSTTPAQPFTCPLTPYGCKAKFTSKNEWKRHITSLHLCLGIWRCTLCSDVATRPNDFNRKDLFIEHLKRMHTEAQSPGGNDSAKTAKNNTPRRMRPSSDQPSTSKSSASNSQGRYEKIADGCWRRLRSDLEHTKCAFCSAEFHGENSCEEWLEHVAKHLCKKGSVTSSSSASSQATTGLQPDSNTGKWDRDNVLKAWLEANHLIGFQPHTSKWVVKDKAALQQQAQEILRGRELMNGDFNSYPSHGAPAQEQDHEDDEEDAVGDEAEMLDC